MIRDFKKIRVVKSENPQSGGKKPGGVCPDAAFLQDPLAGAEAADQPEVTQGHWKVYEEVIGHCHEALALLPRHSAGDFPSDGDRVSLRQVAVTARPAAQVFSGT